MSQLFEKLLKFPVNPKDRIAIKDTSTGKILNIEAGSLFDQIFKLDELGQSCLDYPIRTIEDCETGEEVELPLQILDVLLVFEEAICKLQNQFPKPNIPPVVNAGADQNIQLPLDNITLTAFAYDIDGTIQSYVWEYLSGGTANITTPTSSQTDVTDLSEGAHVFKITVLDNKGASGSDTVIINVIKESILEPPIADAGVNGEMNLPTSEFNLDGSASTDPDGVIVSYLWEQIGGSSCTIVNPNSAITQVTGVSIVGTYKFRLRVTDNNGLTDIDTVEIVVLEEVIYQNEEQELIFTKNDCDLGKVGNEVTYIVDAGTYQSNISVADANQKAMNDINANGQDYANSNGTCESVNYIEVALGDCDNIPDFLSSTVVYTAGGLVSNGVKLYTDEGLTIPFDGGKNTYIIRTHFGVDSTFDKQWDISNTGVISKGINCVPSEDLTITNTVPTYNGGGFIGTLDFDNGEAGEILSLSFAVYVNGQFFSTIFQSPVSVPVLDNSNLLRTGSVTLDSQGKASSSYQITDEQATDIEIVVTITSRSTAKPIPTSDNTSIILS